MTAPEPSICYPPPSRTTLSRDDVQVWGGVVVENCIPDTVLLIPKPLI